MKTRIFLLTLLWMLAMTLQAQTYPQLWNDVAQAEQKDLPKSVIAKAKEIFTKAKAERNVPQMMKAYLTMMDARGNISPDSMAVDVLGLEAWAQDAGTHPTDRAVLYSILGGVCMSEDFSKANQYLNLSLKDSLKLVDYPAGKLVPLLRLVKRVAFTSTTIFSTCWRDVPFVFGSGTSGARSKKRCSQASVRPISRCCTCIRQRACVRLGS